MTADTRHNSTKHRAPSPERVAPVLALLDSGVPEEEVAQRLGLKIRTVRLYASRARKNLGIQRKRVLVRGTIAERLAAKTNKEAPPPAHVPHLGPCHEWTGGQDGAYGFITDTRGEIGPKGKNYRVHRAAYIVAYGDLAADAVLMHLCDNRSCIRPEHLKPGTQYENIHDAVDKGRFNFSRKGPKSCSYCKDPKHRKPVCPEWLAMRARKAS